MPMSGLRIAGENKLAFRVQSKPGCAQVARSLLRADSEGEIPPDVAKALGPQNLRALRDIAGHSAGALQQHAPAAGPLGLGLDAPAQHHEGLNGQARGASGSDDEEGGYGSSGQEDLDQDYDPIYGMGLACTNCTAMLYSDVVCPVRTVVVTHPFHSKGPRLHAAEQ